MTIHRPRFRPSILAALASVLSAAPAVKASDAPDTGVLGTYFFPGLPQNMRKEWGMSAACARMVRKSKMHRMGISHAKI